MVIKREKTMTLLKIIALLACFFKPIPIKANPVKGISDFDGGFNGVERIDFECPDSKEMQIRKPNDELIDVQPPPSCWVDFYATYLNVMDKQVINRNDVISFFQSPPASGKCCASWNLIYRDKEDKTRMLSIRRNVIPFPLTKRKLKKLVTPAKIINRWLVKE